MTANFNNKPPLRNSAIPGYTPQNASAQYAPSVPLSVYRELAAELQATQIMLESLNAQNQQLVQHNQQLRIEIERVVQSALQLRQAADLYQSPVYANRLVDTPYLNMEFDTRSYAPAKPPSRSGFHAHPASMQPKPMVSQLDFPEAPVYTNEVATHHEEIRPRRKANRSQQPSDMSGLWLTLVILVIVICAFGAGFWIVRPFLPNQR